MDLGSYYYHSTRYAASHPPPPAPPAPSHRIPANPGFYNLPPPPSYPPPASQPQFKPQSSQFLIHATNVIEPNHTVHDDYYSRSHQSSPQSPRALHPGPRDSDIPRRLPEFDHYSRDSRPDFRDSPRVLVDSRRRFDFVQDRYGREVNMGSVSPVRIRRELDGKPKFLGDVNGRTEDSTRGEGFLGRDGSEYHHSRDQHRSPRDYMVALHHHNSNSRVFYSDSVDYERRPGLISDHGRVSENHRVIHDREVRRDVSHSMVVMGNKEFSHGDHLRTSSGKREHYNSREANVGSEWHNGKVNREDSKWCMESSYEFNHTPKKQIPKKSAFLRIQKPMFKNKNKTHFSGYYGDSKSGARSKDHSSYSEPVTEDEIRGENHVQIDVSFKLDSLVAKPIVKPSTSVSASMASPVPRNSKIRKVGMSEKDSLSQSHSKPINVAIRLNSVVVKNEESPCKDLEQSKEQDRASTPVKIHTSSVPGSCGNSVTSGEAMLDGSGKYNPPDGGGSIISRSASSETVAKKRKVVRQLVKKNVKVGLSSSQKAKFPDEPSRGEDNDYSTPFSSDSQTVKLRDEPLRAEGCIDSSPRVSGSEKSYLVESAEVISSKCCLSEGTTLLDHCLPWPSECKNHAEVASVDSSGFQVCPKDFPVMPENDILETLEKAVVSDEPNSNDSFLHDASIAIGELQLCTNYLLVRCDNDKLETFEMAVISDKSDSVENSLNDPSVEVGDSQHYLNELPVRLDASEKAMVSDKLIFDGNLVHDAPVEIGDSLRCPKGLPLMTRNRKLEASEKAMISDKLNSDKNFVHDASVEIGNPPLWVNNVPVIPESEKLESLEKDNTSVKPIPNENSMHNASAEISDSMHWPNDSHVIPVSDNETFQKAMLSDKPNTDVSYVHDAPSEDMHIIIIGRVEGNLSTDSNVSDVPSTGVELSFLNGKGGTPLQGFLSEEQQANFKSERSKISEDPKNSRNKDAYLQEDCVVSDSVINSPGKGDLTELSNASRENGQNQRSNASIGLAGQCNEILYHPNSDNVGVANVTATAVYCNHGMRTILGSDNSSSSHGIRYHIVRQSSPDEVTMAVENSTLRCLSDRSCANEGCNTPKRDNCIKNGELNAFAFSRLGVADMELANEPNSATWVDTTLRLSFKDSTTDFKDSSYVGLRPGIDGIDVGRSGSLTAALGGKVLSSRPVIVELDDNSPGCKKKRKISASELDLYFEFASQVNERATNTSVLTAGAEVISDSSSDPTKSEVAVSFVEPLCTLDWSGSRKGFNEGGIGVGVSPSQVNGREMDVSMRTPGVAVLSHSCSDPSQPEDVTLPFMDPLCTLDRSGSDKRFNEGDMSMRASASMVNGGAKSGCLPTHDVEVLSHSCNDQSMEGPPLSVDPLCALDWSDSHKQHNEGDVNMAVSALAVEITSSFESSPAHSGVDVAISNIIYPCTADLQFAKIGNSILVDNHPMGSCFNTKGLIDRVHYEDNIYMPRFALPKVQNLFPSCEGRKTEHATIVLNDRSFQIDSMDLESGNERVIEPEALKDQVVTNNKSTHSQCHIHSEVKSPMSNEALTAVNMETDISYIEKNNPPSVSNHPSLSANLNDHITAIFSDADQVLTNNERAPDHLASDFHSPMANETLTVVGMETSTSYLEKVNLPSGSNRLSLSEELNHQNMDILPDAISGVSYPEKLADDTETSLYETLTGKSSGSDEIPSEKPATEVGNTLDLCSQNRRIVVNSDQAVGGGISFSGRPQNLMSKDSHDIIHKRSFPSEQSCGKKHQSSNVIRRTQPRSSSFVLTTSRSAVHSTHISKPRTWLRSDGSKASTLPGQEVSSSIIATQRQYPAGAQTTSYVRKGNSLVRKSSPVVARSEGSSASVAVNYNTASDSRVDVLGASVIIGALGTNSSIERPRTPPLPIVPKVPHRRTNTSVDRRSSPVESHLGDSVGSKSDPLVVPETKNTPKSSESILEISEAPAILTGKVKNLENPNDVNEGRVGSSTANITYEKRKSNKLVATSSLSVLLAHGSCNSQALSSESYYKRSRNQLVRTTLDDCINPGGRNSDDRSNLEGHSALGMKSRGSLSKRKLRKVVTKIQKPSNYPLVWRLNGAKDNAYALHCRRILPNLFPWKRATYRRNFVPSSLSSSNIAYIISKKLPLSRSHDTIYMRSKLGFSLRKSKVLSVSGSSLKWSKSIQSRSKKANEEATLEVAASDKKKREQIGAGDLVSDTKNRNNYPNELSACSVAPQTEKEAKKPYVPKRLMIAKDEYFRIGIGNKLIRNPKKRSRILASEKVRWSLHTARSRLAKKRKYCQFFTRFGKCNKDDDGKCPYIHDPSKIAVCTKFINGLCSNADCKLTHKVIPERMPDCSYFLQGAALCFCSALHTIVDEKECHSSKPISLAGLCTNKSCPYRHVNVNRSASTCEGFLKGYCADGNECRKKHSYVCPSYEAKGTCPQGSKCKLHHPKNRVKGKKPKRRSREKNQFGHGRYFGSTTRVSAALGSGISVVRRHLREIRDAGPDFISLGFSDDEEAAGEEYSKYRRDDDDDKKLNWSDDGEDLEDLDASNLDELIKPARILNIG
ncbi:unnamed protein product [Linum tenue]|uniref:C3H1-type domain-containing protein n=1 Tax=Linum tenue TaxID=586396 RepID=A0AAV0RZM2_9ROSI|nr:unnamed protein product [Linum tenue]